MQRSLGNLGDSICFVKRIKQGTVKIRTKNNGIPAHILLFLVKSLQLWSFP
jgi:hypothetical protein